MAKRQGPVAGFRGRAQSTAGGGKARRDIRRKRGLWGVCAVLWRRGSFFGGKTLAQQVQAVPVSSKVLKTAVRYFHCFSGSYKIEKAIFSNNCLFIGQKRFTFAPALKRAARSALFQGLGRCSEP